MSTVVVGSSKYVALHNWVRLRKGRATSCDICKTTTSGKYEWSNISGEYKRELSDYRSLCASCHRLLDRGGLCQKRLHKLDEANTYVLPTGIRRCRKCSNRYMREYNRKKKGRE